MPGETETKVARTKSGYRSRAKLPTFEVPDLEAITEAHYVTAVEGLMRVDDPDQRLDVAVSTLERIQKRLEDARAKRDQLVQSLYYFENARGAKFEGAAGLSHVQMDRVKLKALGDAPRPRIDGTERIDRDAARALAVANGLTHDPQAAEKLPKAAESVAALVGQEKAALEVRDSYVQAALAEGVSRVAIAERIGRIPSQVTRMARRSQVVEAVSA